VRRECAVSEGEHTASSRQGVVVNEGGTAGDPNGEGSCSAPGAGGGGGGKLVDPRGGQAFYSSLVHVFTPFLTTPIRTILTTDFIHSVSTPISRFLSADYAVLRRGVQAAEGLIEPIARVSIYGNNH